MRAAAPRPAPMASPNTHAPPGMWELSISEPTKRRVLWSGTGELDATVLSESLPLNLTEVQVSELAIQVIRSAPMKSIPKVLSMLACQYDRTVVARKNKTTGIAEPFHFIDMAKLTQAAANSGRSVCGQVFKKGDLVWTCRNCAKDPTCVQCDPCFRKSDHKGHEVYFHRAGGDSGCCDCGDPEAWCKHGNCSEHSEERGPDYDPSACLPTELKRGYRAVVQGVLSYLATYAVHNVRGFEALENNEFMAMMTSLLPMDSLVARVHNDDVHTYTDVSSAFQRCGFSRQEADRMTEKVDKEGCAVLGTELSSSDKLQHLFKECRTEADLIFSIVPKELLDTEENLLVALKWVLTIGNMSEGFRRMIAEEMLAEVGSIAAHNIPLLAKTEYEGFQLSRVFLDEGQFPSEISQVAPIETLHLPFSGRISTPAVASPSMEEEFKERVRFPFHYCHKNPLSLLCLASPFLTAPLRKWLHDVVMRFQHDLMFKNGFSQIISTVYPSLAVLFCRHYGTAEESIFRVTVQLYTANSVVDLLSSAGIANRILPERNGRHILISNMLSNTFYALLCDIGLTAHASKKTVEAFLNHHSIRKNRVSMICRDFEYICTDNVFCIQLLNDQVNPGTIADWLDVCKLVQNIDEYVRLTNQHVERENDQWQYAANLVLEIETVTTHIVSFALLDTSVAENENDFHTVPAASVDAISHLQAMRKQAVDNLTRLGIQAVQDHYQSYPEQQVVVDILGSLELSFKKYTLSSDPVSLHIPLHRLIMKGLMYAAAGHVSLQDALAMIRALPDATKRLLVDFPTRCLAFSSQVQCGMWRRNGLATANLAYNYARAPLSRTMRDLDVLAIQTACLTSKPDRILLFVAERFEVLNMLEKLEGASTSSGAPDTLQEYRPKLLSEYLHTVIQVMTYLPVALLQLPEHNQVVEGVELALAREVFHQILAGNQTISALQKAKTMIGTQRTVSDQMLLNVAQSLCHRRTGADNDGSGGMEESSKLQLKDDSYQYFDPEFPNLTTKQALQVLDRVRDRMKHNASNAANNSSATSGPPAGPRYANNPYRPVVRIEALPVPHPDFAPVRNVLMHPRFMEILRRSLELSVRSIKSPDSTGFQRSTIIGRVIHLLTVHIHHATDGGDATELLSLYEVDTPGYEVVKILGQVWQKEVFKDDILYHQGLGFVLYQLSAQLDTVQEVLKGYGFTAAKTSTNSVEDEKKRLRKEAQERALQEAKARAQQAMAMFGAEMSEDEEDEDEEDHSAMDAASPAAQLDLNATIAQRKKKLQQVSESCIVCKEKTEQPIGYLSFLQASNVQKHILTSQSEIAKSLQKVYRVVARNGCDLHGDCNEQTAVLHHIPYNEHVVVEARSGAWMKVVSPYHGWAQIYTSASTVAANLLCGSNPAIQYSRQFTRVLYPVSDLLFQKNGGTRVHIATCGHVIHFDCWDMVYSASYARNLSRGQFAESFAIDVEKGECLCPLCKSITNSIVPIVDLKQAEHSMVDFDQNSDDEDTQPMTAAEAKGSFSSSITDLLTLSETTKPFFDLLIPSLRMKRSIRSIRLIDARLHSNILQLYPTLSVKEDVKSVSGLKLSELDGWFNEKLKALRMLHASSSAFAYTLSSVALRQLKQLASPDATGTAAMEGHDAYQAWGIPATEASFLRQLLHVIHRTPTLFANSDFLFHRLCVFPMLQLLFGADDSEKMNTNRALDQTNAQLGKQWRHLLRSLPFQAIHSLDCPDIGSILESLQKATAQCGEGYFTSELWGFAHSPLLTQDLTVVATTLLAILEDVDAKKACMTILVAAKIAQVLVDPEATRLVDSATSSSNAQKKRMKLPGTTGGSVDAQITMLLTLQAILCDKANVPHDASADGEQLLIYVADSLLPFLDFLTRLYDLEDLPLQYESIFAAKQLMQEVGKREDRLVAVMEQLLAALELHSLPALLQSPLVNLLYSRWAADLALYYPQTTANSEVKWLPTDSSTSRTPESGAKTKGNKRSHKARSDSAGSDIDRIMSSIDATATRSGGDYDYFGSDVDLRNLEHGQEDVEFFEDEDDEEDMEHFMEEMEGGEEDADGDVFHDAVDGVEFDMNGNAIGDFEPEFANEEEAELAAGDAITANPPRSMDELMQRLRNMTRGNPMVDSLLGMFGGADADAHLMDGSRARGKSRAATWKQYGVLPVNVMVDECSVEECATIAPLTNHYFAPLQGSVTGSYPIYSVGGALCPYRFPDLSHFNLTFRSLMSNCLIPLPELYTDLYHTAKFPEGPNGVTIDDPVMCLLCGSVLCAGRRPGDGMESAINPGECSLHSEQCGAGVGVFFLLHHCQILFIRANRAIYYPSIYLDATGESCEGSHQNKPMFLSQKRYRKLEETYITHQIAKEVARKRASSETVIRQFWH